MLEPLPLPKARLEALTDGIFAVTMTLLVLDLILLCEALMWRHAARHLVNETVTDAHALWQYMRRRFMVAAAVIVAGIVAALVEIRFGTKVGYASYVYLLLIGAGIIRPGKRAPRGAARKTSDEPGAHGPGAER